ncbi:FolB domain-containing protein [Rubrobacter taiwanensis]|jgi:dihydroneopterin aldolase|uniref:FolB domain-containing protein n=1 Tax=Rubrobacter taiwanensis TaxID=185139 RepID=A0A4R1BGB4_9ACTN|nr:dihydroneopterin aldolase [Rubrobacter taiwanensis]TCJ16229.1 FolB domain-containing protein [Rubrobacter taiwanensis]
MFERFTDRAREAVELAREEAGYFGHSYIGTEHLLLGLVRQRDGAARRALSSLGVSLKETRDLVGGLVGYGRGPAGEDFPFTPPARRALEAALREALQRGDTHVGTEHLLLGLLHERRADAYRVLDELGLEPERVRRELERVLKEAPARDEPGRAGEDRTPEGEPPAVLRAAVRGLEVHARCGVSPEERALPQKLLLDLEYSYAAGGNDDIRGVVDYGELVEGAARVLERREFRLLETAVGRVGRFVLESFPDVLELEVAITKVRVPVGRSLGGVTVRGEFRR